METDILNDSDLQGVVAGVAFDWQVLATIAYISPQKFSKASSDPALDDGVVETIASYLAATRDERNQLIRDMRALTSLTTGSGISANGRIRWDVSYLANVEVAPLR